MKIYVETSVISYLAARPSSDSINATRQHFSYRLWSCRDTVDLLISDAVLFEAKIGDPEAVRNRLVYCDSLSIISAGSEVERIAAHLIQSRAIPQKAFTDAVHIAIAASNNVPFIASWNFRHVVGAVVRRNIESALRDYVASVPVIATPEEILESL